MPLISKPFTIYVRLRDRCINIEFSYKAKGPSRQKSKEEVFIDRFDIWVFNSDRKDMVE